MIEVGIVEREVDVAKVNELLYSYICELHQIDSFVKVRDKTALLKEYFGREETRIYYLKEQGQVIGFSVIGVGSCGCRDGVNFYIGEFYIVTQFRKQGYGKDFIREIIKQEKEKQGITGEISICYYILQKNLVAKRFWENFFKDSKDITNEISDINLVDPKILSWQVKVVSNEIL